MSDIFQEVDEEVRRDKAAEFWAKYQNYLFAGAAVIVLAAAGYRYYDYRSVRAAETSGAEFQQAIVTAEANKSADAIGMLDKIDKEGPSGYHALARLTAAGLMAKTDAPGALALYDGLAGDASIGSIFQATARLRAALLRLDIPAESEKGEAALKSLAEEGPYKRIARLSLGALALSRQDYDGASKAFDQIFADPEATAAERKQAEEGLGLIAANRAGPK